MNIKELKLGDKLAFDGTMVVTAVTFNPNKVEVRLQGFAAATSIWLTQEEVDTTRLVEVPVEAGKWVQVGDEKVLRRVTEVDEKTGDLKVTVEDGSVIFASTENVTVVELQTDPFT